MLLNNSGHEETIQYLNMVTKVWLKWSTVVLKLQHDEDYLMRNGIKLIKK